MAAQSRIYTLNIGTQTIRFAEFRAVDGGGVALANFKTSELQVSENTSDSTRKAQIQAAITELMTETGIKGGPVNYAITAQSVFTRFVKLPSVSEEKVEQIIQFEAQQNVPFPINEVVWDYQLVGGNDEGKLEVVLVAIKSDLLNEINSAVESAGFKTSLVDVAPMALYNAFRYNYSELSGCSLLIDIGARTTNLIFVEPRKVFSRSIPIGGNTITSAVAKELSIPYGAAENRKKKDGYVSLGGSYAEHQDPDIARMSKIIRNTMTRLHAEITRSVSFFRAQQQGSQPVRVFLCGGSANLPYMREFFSEKLQLPIEYFNPLRNVAVGAGVDLEAVSKHAHEVGELVGLGLRSGAECPMELNLRPETVIRQQALDARKPYFVFASVCLLLILAGWWIYFLKAAEVKREVLSDVQTRVAELQQFENKIKRVSREIDTLQKEAEPLFKIPTERQYWTALFMDFHQRLPEKFIWITSLEPTSRQQGEIVMVVPDGFKDPADAPQRAAASKAKTQAEDPKEARIDGLRLRGLYMGNPPNTKGQGVVDLFVQQLSQSPYVDGAPEVLRRTTPTQLEWAYDFELQVKLKQPLDFK
jgi:type IV pilus assembly protein PilM